MLTVEQIDSILAHMNTDHADAVLLYARALGKRREATAARMEQLSVNTMTLTVEDGSGTRSVVQIPLEAPAQTPAQTRQVLIAMARRARTMTLD